MEFLMTSPIVGMMIQSDELHHFIRGVGIPPIRICLFFLAPDVIGISWHEFSRQKVIIHGMIDGISAKKNTNNM